jgi:hypothetical protein
MTGVDADTGGAEGRLPDFLIIGSPKSGTTSLAAWLAAHPDVFVPPQKELHFFSRDDRWELGTEGYAAEFAGAGRRRLAGEATPNYLDDEGVAARLAATVPAARLIAILREPVERAWSHHCYDRDLGIDTTPFEQVVASAGGPDEHRYLWQGRYVRHLERYTALMPREQMLVLWFDELRDHPEQTWREVCRFLDLPADPVPDAIGTVHNRHYTVRLPWVRRAMVRGRAWKRLPLGLAPRLDRLLRSERAYDELDPKVREELRSTYIADDQALAAWLGRPLPAGWPA